MLFLTAAIHTVFALIFFLFHRYIEMSLIIVIFVIFLSKIIAPLDVIKRPAFFKIKTPQNTTLEQSIYISSGILFYTALVGIALGLSEVLGIPADLHLFHYCVFFLTSVVYGIYLLSYPKNPNVFILFRNHSMLVWVIVGLLVQGSVLLGLYPLEPLVILNLLLSVLGLSVVVLLDRTAPTNVHVLSVYALIFACISTIVGTLSFFTGSTSSIIFVLTLALTGLYIFFPSVIERAYIRKNIPALMWHFSNCILALSWAIFLYLFWSLFWGYMDDRMVISFSLLMILGLWLWVYNTDDGNPIFFTGMITVLATFFGFLTFQILPPIFWMITICLFVFSGALVVIAGFFKNKPEELILAGWSVIYLCASDIVLIFQNNNLFELSTLFFFQSFLWYGVYEIFHRQANVKNRAL